MKGALPNWLERLLGIGSAGAGEGTVWSLETSWDWAPWATLLFAMVAVVFFALLYWRDAAALADRYRALLVACRLFLVAIVLFMIAEALLALQRTGLPYAVVVLDDSASMGIVDRYEDAKQRQRVEKLAKQAGYGELSRINLAKSVLLNNDAALLRRIADDYQLRLFFVSGAARGTSGSFPQLVEQIRALEATGEASRLGQGTRTILGDLRGTPLVGLIFLTDGVTTDGESLSAAAQYARRKSVPLFTVAVGNEEPLRDLEISDLLVDEVVFVDDVVSFELKLTAKGFDSRQVQVVLREADSTVPLVTLPVRVGPDETSQRVRIPYRPTAVGEFEYMVEVAAQPDELSPDNNRKRCLVSVRKEQIRVLYVQSYPNYEFRYLKNMLARDSTVELDTLLQEADPEYAEQDKTALRHFPARREELFEYDVLVFGDVNPSFLSASVMQNIADFVTEKGGGVIFVAGPLFTPTAYRDSPLDGLFPVDLSAAASPESAAGVADAYVIEPTELGLASAPMQLGDTPEESRRIWRTLPGLYWLLDVPRARPGAIVLAQHSSRLAVDGTPLPIFCMQYVGAGKVLFHATDETWRWRYQVGDVFFARYWVQAIRWLSRSKLLGKDRSAELTVDRNEYRRGEPIHLRVRFLDERTAPAADDAVTVLLERDGSRKQPLTLRRNATYRGIFEGVVTSAAEGSYHAWLAAPATTGRAPSSDFVVAAPASEMERVQMDSADLKRAAADSGGRYFTVIEAARLERYLPKGKQVPKEILPPIVLWDKYPLLALFLLVLVAEWSLRKFKGML